MTKKGVFQAIPAAGRLRNLMAADRHVGPRSRRAHLLVGLLVAGLGLGEAACGSKSSSGPSTATGGTSGGAAGGNTGETGGETGGGGSAVGGAAAGSSGSGGGVGGTGGVGSGGAGGRAIDPACGVPTPVKAPPYPTEFRLRNDGPTPLYLHQGCIGIDYGISSCATGYRDSVEPMFQCACSCDSPSCTGGLACGQCPEPTATLVAAGKSVAVTWDAIVRTSEDRGTYTCLRARNVGPGRYRIAVRVYDEAAAARVSSGGRIVTQDFELPAAMGVLEIPLATVQPDPCAGPSTAATPACSGREARDQACTLPLSMAYGVTGGRVSRSNAAALAPPAQHTLTQTFADTATMPVRQCVVALPLCARDARVVTTSDLTRVLTSAVVTGAFGTNMPVFGYDPRASDGSILVLRDAAGKTLGIGSSRASAVVPPELLEVQTVLDRLDQQMLGDPSCANIAR